MHDLSHHHYSPKLQLYQRKCHHAHCQRTIIENDIGFCPSHFRGIHQGDGTQLSVEYMSCKGGLNPGISWVVLICTCVRNLRYLYNICPVQTVDTIDAKYAFLLRHNQVI